MSPPPIAGVLLGATLLAALSGCAGPGWFTSADDVEIPVPPTQAAKVYPRATTVGRRPIERPAPTPSASEESPTAAANEQTTPTRSASEAAALTHSVSESSPPTRNVSEDTKKQATDAQPTMKRLPPVDPEEKPEEKTTVAEAKSPLDVKPAANEAKEDEGQGSVKPAVATSDDKSESAAVVKAAAETKPAYQSGDWLKSRDLAISALQEEIRLGKADPARAAEIAQLETQLRLHYALAGRRDEAVEPITGLRSAEQEFWRNEALALVDLLGPNRLPNESRRFAVALKSLEEAESQLAAASSLTLRNLTLCRKVQDFGVTEKFPRYDFTPNQEVLLYVEVRNFAAEEKSDQTFETELQGSFRVLDRSGASRAERTLPLDKQTCSNFRRDYYIAYRIYLPSELSPGAYTLELTVEDKKGNKSNNALLDFNVVQ